MQERRRRGATKALRKGFEVRESLDFDLFWPILESNLEARHHARPVHTLTEMLFLKTRFPHNIRLFGTFAESTMCAGTVLYCAPPTIHAQYIASDDAARTNGALDLLFSMLIGMNWPKARYFDFGNSNEEGGRMLNRGLAEFKEGFGARAICHDFYRLQF